MPRDKRWEKVWASVTPYFPFTDTEEPDDALNCTELLIEISDEKGILWYTRQVIHNDYLQGGRFDIFKFLMDEMVETIDGFLNKAEPPVPVRDRHAKILQRVCVQCKVNKPLNEECFGRKATTKSGFRGICRKCERKNHVA